MASRYDLIETQAQIVSKLQQEVLDTVPSDRDQVLSLSVAIDKYVTLLVNQ